MFDQLSGFSGPVVFFLKATIRRQITVPGYTRHDGTVVPPHQRTVLVSTDHDDARVLSGQGSHSQRQAHDELMRHAWFHQLPHDHRVAVLLAHATDRQEAASRSAQLSGWRQRARAGQNPSAAQWGAFRALPADRKAAELAAVQTAVGNRNHLRDPGGSVAQSTLDRLAADHGSGVPAEHQPSGTVVEHRATPDPLPVQAPAPTAGPADRMRAMRTVPVPVFPDTSETNRASTRRAAQLRALAEAGNLDSISNFSTSRTRANYARLDDYRAALLAVAQGATAEQATEAISRPAPRPPQITGANMQNSALLAAQRKCAVLYAATREGNPVAAILAVSTSRGNRYLNAADDYKRELLLHYGRDAAGNPIAGASAESGRAPASPTTVRPATPAPVVRPTPVPAATPATTPAPVPPAQNPVIAANPYGLSEADLGFVPRPNVPLNIRTNQLPAGYRWPHPEMAELNRRYLAQDTRRQSRARDYQAGNWHPDTPETRTRRAMIEAERQAAEAERRRQEMEQIRAAAAAVEARMANVDALFKPNNQPGHNITTFQPMTEATQAAASRILGIPPEQIQRLMATLVADYGGNTRFTLSIRASGNEMSVDLNGDDGTRITRDFTRSGASLTVYHAYFRAGRTGSGAGKHLFRTSMSVYMGLGVSEIGVTANIDVGGYAWARFGYKPRNWNTLRSTLQARLLNLARGPATVGFRVPDPNGGPDRRQSRTVPALAPEVVTKIQRVLENQDAATLWAIADMKVGEREVGKELLLGTNWSGVMQLNDQDVMARFKRYVAPRER